MKMLQNKKRVAIAFARYAVVTLTFWLLKLVADLATFAGLSVLDDKPTVHHSPPVAATIVDNIVNFPVFTFTTWAQQFPIGQRYLWGSSHTVDFAWWACYLLSGLWWTSLLGIAARIVKRPRSRSARL